MTRYLILVLLMIIIPYNAIGDTSKREWCERAEADRKLYLKYPKSMPHTPPSSNVMSPFKYDTPVDKIISDNLAKYLSGYYCDSLSNLPLIFASSDGFTVIGPGFHKTFPANELKKAIKAYINLLSSSGYLKTK